MPSGEWMGNGLEETMDNMTIIWRERVVTGVTAGERPQHQEGDDYANDSGTVMKEGEVLSWQMEGRPAQEDGAKEIKSEGGDDGCDDEENTNRGGGLSTGTPEESGHEGCLESSYPTASFIHAEGKARKIDHIAPLHGGNATKVHDLNDRARHPPHEELNHSGFRAGRPWHHGEQEKDESEGAWRNPVEGGFGPEEQKGGHDGGRRLDPIKQPPVRVCAGDPS